MLQAKATLVFFVFIIDEKTSEKNAHLNRIQHLLMDLGFDPNERFFRTFEFVATSGNVCPNYNYLYEIIFILTKACEKVAYWKLRRLYQQESCQ